MRVQPRRPAASSCSDSSDLRRRARRMRKRVRTRQIITSSSSRHTRGTARRKCFVNHLQRVLEREPECMHLRLQCHGTNSSQWRVVNGPCTHNWHRFKKSALVVQCHIASWGAAPLTTATAYVQGSSCQPQPRVRVTGPTRNQLGTGHAIESQTLSTQMKENVPESSQQTRAAQDKMVGPTYTSR